MEDKRRMRIRYTNRFKCLLCYLISFSIPLAWQLWALGVLYPRKLANAAPDIALHLSAWFPALPIRSKAATLKETLVLRDQNWLTAMALCAACAWIITLLIQLCWRTTHRSPIRITRGTARAIRAYRLMMLVQWMLCAAFCMLLWHFGLKHVPGRTVWDWVVTMGMYPLLPLCAMCVSRLAAPSVLSGKHAFFKRW